MGKRETKPKRGSYIPGASWRDVMAGKPVLRSETGKRRGKSRSFRCRDCGRSARLPRASKPRCEECGGILDPELCRANGIAQPVVQYLESTTTSDS
jgi:hypothetical protein